MTTDDNREQEGRPYIVNPEAVGDPEQTPIVQLPPALAAFFERTRCAECGYINQCHTDECSHETVHAEALLGGDPR